MKKIKDYPDNNSLTDSRAIKKEVERIIKVPRTRMSDCKRLIFSEGCVGWVDIDSVPILHPQYPMPPMEKDHYIMWIALVSENRITKVKLYPEQATTTRFSYIPKSTIYAYCNKHGLWKKVID